MTLAAQPVLELEATFARSLVGLHEPWRTSPVADPSLVVLNEALAVDLGLDVAALRSPAGLAILAGNTAPDGSTPVAQAYAGHQFGGYSPRLGDGRALLLGELVDPDGNRRDLHLKGSGRTPFARGGDGRAALGPMLREYLVGEAMHALGIPTTRMLAVVSTGESIAREVDGRRVAVPGAVLTRVASSHLRVGTFQFAAATGDPGLLRNLVDFAIDRHAPDAADAENPALALFDHVVSVQASLIAHWMQVGFVHGVMNTDNMTISGETIDYGPCAFLDTYDPATVFSSIDHGGRYAYGNQPAIATWNLARLAEAMLSLFDDDADRAVELATSSLEAFPEQFRSTWTAGMERKLGLSPDDPDGPALIADLLTALHDDHLDYTGTIRSLSSIVRGDLITEQPAAFAGWSERWLPHVTSRPEELDQVNPIHIPRNHLVEEALAAAVDGDLDQFERLLDVVTDPFRERSDSSRYAGAAPSGFDVGYQTFCGT